jgi:hypothetical protein
MEKFDMLNNVPNIWKNPLNYVFENMQVKQKENTLWLEFGVGGGSTINYIASQTSGIVHGFDSFYGNPEKCREGFEAGHYNMNGDPPPVASNVVLVQGMFQDTLKDFLVSQNKKISFIHFDCDLYSSTKFVLDSIKDYIDSDCIIVFDEFVNFLGFGEAEYQAFYEFTLENNINYKLIGMNGSPKWIWGEYPNSSDGVPHEQLALILTQPWSWD